MGVGSLLKIPVSSRSKHENGMLSRRGIFAKRTQMLQLSRRIGQEASRWRKRFTASDADHLPAERVVNILRGGATCRPPRNISVWFLFFPKRNFHWNVWNNAHIFYRAEVKFKSPRWDLCLRGRLDVAGKSANLGRDGYGHVGGFVGPIVGSFNFWRVQHSSQLTKRWKKRRKCLGLWIYSFGCLGRLFIDYARRPCTDIEPASFA